MAKLNISASITAEKIAEVKSSLESIKAAMPFLINLNKEERKTLQKLGTGSFGFVEDALNVSKNHVSILPNNFDTQEFEKDVWLAHALNDINSVLVPLAEGVSDTLVALGGEAMKQSNVIYAQVKIAAKNNEGMKEIRTRMGERYKKNGPGKTLQPVK